MKFPLLPTILLGWALLPNVSKAQEQPLPAATHTVPINNLPAKVVAYWLDPKFTQPPGNPYLSPSSYPQPTFKINLPTSFHNLSIPLRTNSLSFEANEADAAEVTQPIQKLDQPVREVRYVIENYIPSSENTIRSLQNESPLLPVHQNVAAATNLQLSMEPGIDRNRSARIVVVSMVWTFEGGLYSGNATPLLDIYDFSGMYHGVNEEKRKRHEKQTAELIQWQIKSTINADKTITTDLTSNQLGGVQISFTVPNGCPVAIWGLPAVCPPPNRSVEDIDSHRLNVGGWPDKLPNMEKAFIVITPNLVSTTKGRRGR